MGLFWLYAAFHAPFRSAAILTTAIFCGGLVVGRIVSLFNEGLPAPLLTFYVVAELVLVPVAWWVYRLDE